MATNLGPNGHLVGVAGGAARLATPALVLDFDLFQANLARMAQHGRDTGLALRPHAKTHKSADIARLQRAAGAIGVCCAKLGEAEALADHWADMADVLLTSPVVTPDGIARLIRLAARVPGLMVVADNAANVAALGHAAWQAGILLPVLVDIDLGMHRTGIASPRAEALARRIATTPGLTFAGIQAYGGQWQHIADYDARRAKVLEGLEALTVLVGALDAAGLPARIVTGGGTGTHAIDPAARVFTELQVGSYIFMDVDYDAVALEGPAGANGAPPPFGPALAVQVTVISANAPGLATTDGGVKAFATDGPAPRILAGAPPGASYRFMGDEYGCVTLPEGTALGIGDVLLVQVPHCDPTVNLHDWIHVVRDGTLEAIWPVHARGRSS
ncbi:DSD1 family PLP-dependent enzyme [Zavarzinia sp. CC-PAN008]|uniref:DSD1 family PLP-dependent enzyme n=1 Tax=Zavarzinia sp. CC-PAN008 TaxID=3243332 RepID=UPI003F743EBB